VAFVIDASTTLTLVLPKEPQVAPAMLQHLRNDEGIAPAIWWCEVRNGLLMNERRRRLTIEESERALRDLSSLTIVIDHAPDDAALMTLARKHRLTVYDAAYLELAMRRNLHLATLDTALAAAARAEGLALIGDAQR
jgi:predicted nucleic acid-binding protein